MPFTLSHPAAAVPLYRCRLVLSALVVGSLSPDFEYFLHSSGQDRTGHTYPGVLLYTLPLSFLALFIFHALMKWPLISLLPPRLQVRLVNPARQFSWWPTKRLALVLLSLVVGIATHLLWDSFTHADGWVAQRWAILLAPVFHVGRSTIAVYKLAQYGSTAIGAVVLAAYSVRWYRAAPQCELDLLPRLSLVSNGLLLLVLSLVAIGAGFVSAMPTARASSGLPFLRLFATSFMITSISVAAVELAAFSTIWWLAVSHTRIRK